jgi:hypothetical protein
MATSRSATNLIIGIMTLILRTAFLTTGPSLTIRQQDILKQMPTNINMAFQRLNLDGVTCVYAACPVCHCTYKPEFKLGSSVPMYPGICTNRQIPEVVCGAELVKNGDSAKPHKTFVYHSFHDFLAGILANPEFEKAMNGASEDFVESLKHPQPTFATSVFDAEFVKSFKGPDAHRLFLDGGMEGRYFFMLNVDFFNVEGMSTRGAKTSCGIISMACLNLPAGAQYKPENLYLAGIIPGPKEPHLNDLNHYLRPLVDDLLVSWERGIQFSRTANFENRVTRSAVAAAVNDLPAARKVAALAGHTSARICSVCNCQEREGLSRHDPACWINRDVNKLRQQAEEWKNAKTLKERKDLFDKTGVRWTEMWRLPYWDPTKQLVIDAMRCILEGLVAYHVRSVLKLTWSAASVPHLAAPAFSYNFTMPDSQQLKEKEQGHARKIHRLLTAGVPGNAEAQQDHSLNELRRQLDKNNLPALEFVGSSLGCRVKGRSSKKSWIEQLITWVSTLSFLPFLTHSFLLAREKNNR